MSQVDGQLSELQDQPVCTKGKVRLWRLIYNTLWFVVLPFLVAKLLFRAYRMPSYRWALSERFLPTLPHQYTNNKRSSIMVHAVSVGETVAAKSFAQELITAYPEYDVWVTSTTVTGRQTVQQHFAGAVLQRYLPFDLPFLMPIFLRQHHVKLMIIMETELWPNLYHACAKQNIPLMIANARLSRRSSRRYRQLFCLSKDTLSKVNYIACRDELDYERFISLGANPNHLSVTGNIKYDVSVPDGVALKADFFRRILCCL